KLQPEKLATPLILLGSRFSAWEGRQCFRWRRKRGRTHHVKMVAQMSVISGTSPSAFALAALCLGGQVAQAQSQLQSQVQSQSQGEAQSQSQKHNQANPVSHWN